MKKQDLPQDESNLQSANMTEVLYVTDENDQYTTANSIGWEAKKMALDESLSLINEIKSFQLLNLVLSISSIL